MKWTWTYSDLLEWINKGCDKEIAMFIDILDMSFNKLTEIPKEIFNLTNLKTLNISNNQITEIPKEIFNLTNLTYLDISNNKIKEIPKEIFNLTNLTDLYVSNNQISEMPKEICNLTNLTDLYVSNNQISEIPKEIFNLTNLTNLTDLDISNNQIKEIPKEIVNLSDLYDLDISNNQITEIPKEIGNLTNLQYFYCSNNKIKKIPYEIITLYNLNKFVFNGNQIGYIRPDIKRVLNNINNKNSTIKTSNSQIKDIIKNSIMFILDITPNINNNELHKIILENEILSDTTKESIYEDIKNAEIHSILNITFEEFLSCIISIIETNPDKNKIYKIFQYIMSLISDIHPIEKIDKLICCLTQFYNEINFLESNFSNNSQINESNKYITEENKKVQILISQLIINKIKTDLEINDIYSIQLHKELSYIKLRTIYEESIVIEMIKQFK